mmetsp:Transcript_38930/g.47138  ORF Transcript_38930/g.47138 Transcript_38930/m.47138 type:complete len:140 (-) Transcript_38930:838-1257(-)
MPHGDFSDMGALVLLAGGIQQTFYPHLCFKTYHPSVKPFFDTDINREMEVMIRFCGTFLLIIGCMLFTVRWNTINGKLSGLACVGAAVNAAYCTYVVLDAEEFVPRPFYIYVVVLAITGLHLMFNANPVIKAADGKKKN